VPYLRMEPRTVVFAPGAASCRSCSLALAALPSRAPTLSQHDSGVLRPAQPAHVSGSLHGIGREAALAAAEPGQVERALGDVRGRESAGGVCVKLVCRAGVRRFNVCTGKDENLDDPNFDESVEYVDDDSPYPEVRSAVGNTILAPVSSRHAAHGAQRTRTTRTCPRAPCARG
jgi:hypothetical protein